jgi:hypothetical protein
MNIPGKHRSHPFRMHRRTTCFPFLPSPRP